MGSFNVAGSMSNLSLRCGTEVVFIPLIPNRNNYKIRGTKEKGDILLTPSSQLVSNEGASYMYVPAFLPIKGIYNDYGSLKEIERDANVEYIEDYFGITIDEFMAQVTRNWCNDHNAFCEDESRNELLYNLSGMFESRQVYDDMVAMSKVEHSAYNSSYLSSVVLEELGFIYNKDESTGDDRYNMYYKHPEIPVIAIHCDGSFSNVIDLTKNKEINNVFKIKDLEEKLKKHFDVILSMHCDLDELKQMPYDYFEIKDIINKRANSTNEENEGNEESSEYNELMEYINTLEPGESRDKMLEMSVQVKEIMKGVSKIEPDLFILKSWITMEYCVDDKFLDDFVNLLSFDIMMFLTNNYYSPAMNGSQEGDKKASKALYESCLRYLEK